MSALKRRFFNILFYLNIFLSDNDCLETLIKNSPVIFKALASQNVDAFNDNTFQNNSTTTELASLILVASVIYKGKPIFTNFDNTVFKGWANIRLYSKLHINISFLLRKLLDNQNYLLQRNVFPSDLIVFGKLSENNNYIDIYNFYEWTNALEGIIWNKIGL